jgi:hypothetical protein
LIIEAELTFVILTGVPGVSAIVAVATTTAEGRSAPTTGTIAAKLILCQMKFILLKK